MSDSENSAAEPVAESIDIPLGKVSLSKKHQPTGQPRCWLDASTDGTSWDQG